MISLVPNLVFKMGNGLLSNFAKWEKNDEGKWEEILMGFEPTLSSLTDRFYPLIYKHLSYFKKALFE